LEHIFWALLFAFLAAPFGHWTYTHRRDLWLSAKCSLLYRKRRIRISCAALLRIEDEAGQYLLGLARLRRGTLGPFGGAFKYSDKGKAQLDKLGFEQQVMNEIDGPGIERDLRGHLRGASVAGFLRWFHSKTGRENDTECLRRELCEELAEVGLPALVPLADSLEFTLVREVIEPPVRDVSADYWQMRIFHVCDLDPGSPGALSLRQQLLSEAKKAISDLKLASADDIRRGRLRDGSGSSLIGHQAAYLFRALTTLTDQKCYP
jgi:hypothetical protein